MQAPYPVIEGPGRSHVRPKVRPNLTLTAADEEPSRHYVLKDPISLRFFRLDERQKNLVALMDGRRTLAEIRAAFDSKYRPDRISSEQLEGFLAQLWNVGLVIVESAEARDQQFQQVEKRARHLRWAKFANPLSIKIPLGDPNAWLEKAMPWVQFVFQPGFVLFALVGFFAALVWTTLSWRHASEMFRLQHEYFTPETLLSLWVVLGLVKIAHELGHAFCCKVKGGDVHEMGVLLLFFFPALYCDVSDSWRFSRRRDRMAVAAAGMYVETILASLAMLVWWNSEPRSFLHSVAFHLMVVCTITTFTFNLNPLMRFDGYFLFSDWLGVPNLAEAANRNLKNQVLGLLGCPATPEPLYSPFQRQVLEIYAVASFVFRMVVTATSFYLLHAFLKPYSIASLCYPLAGLTLVSMAIWPMIQLTRSIYQQRVYRDWKVGRLLLIGTLTCLFVAAVFLVPLPSFVDSLALVQIDPSALDRHMAPDSGGVLREILVREGQAVRAGQELLVFENPKIELALQVNEVDQSLRLRQIEALTAARLASMKDAGTESLAGLELELQSLRHMQQVLRRQKENLVVRASREGTVVAIPGAENAGKWFERGREICQIGDTRHLRATLLVTAADQARIQVSQRVSIMPNGSGGAVTPGQVREIALTDVRQIPAQLSSRAGGNVVVDPATESTEEKPKSPHYLVGVRFARLPDFVQPGVMARVSIHTEPLTAWQRLQRYLALHFHWGL